MSSTSTQVKSFTIEPRLSGQDTFFQWQFMIKILLSASGLWDTDDSPKADPTALFASTANVTEEVRSLLIDAATAKVCWAILKTKFGDVV